MKIRSSRACIAEGYRLYTNHFRTIVRRTWITAVIYSIVTSILGTFCVMTMPRLGILQMRVLSQPEAVMTEDFMPLIWFVLLDFAFIAVAIWMVSCGFCLLREHHQTSQITIQKKWYIPCWDSSVAWRTLKAVVCMTLIGSLVALIVWATQWGLFHVLSPIASIVATSLVAIFFVFLMLPFIYTTTKYLMTKGRTFWELAVRDYATAFRHWGIVFVVVLVTVLIVLLVQGFISMPALILTEANVQANMGVIMGDPLGMPSYMTILTAAVFFLAGFVQAYVHLSILFPAYYMYGTIDIQEQERKNEKNPIH